MPLIGDLCDIPLPDVLLFIGQRTGRFRISGVPFFGQIELDFCEGEVTAMQAGNETVEDIDQMLANLGVVVRMKKCRFEFTMQVIQPAQSDNPLTITQLVVLLINYVEEQADGQKAMGEVSERQRQEALEVARKVTGFRWAANAAREVQRMTDKLRPSKAPPLPP